jgi:predicted Fe-Mo cluster-binding NifX family protein
VKIITGTGTKVIAATTKGGLDGEISPVFGRCQTLTVVEIINGEIKDAKIISNPFIGAMGGAGIQAAQLVINEGANVAIAGSFGPNAQAVLAQAGVKTIQAQGIVRDVIMKYLSGEIKPSVGFSGSGMGRGFGRGCGWGIAYSQPPAAPEVPQPFKTEVFKLRDQVQALERDLEEIKQRLKALEKVK